MENSKVFVIDKPELSAIRLDKALVSLLNDASRTYISKLFDDGLILLNGKKMKASTKTCLGDVISVIIPEKEVLNVVSQDIPLDIVYEDNDLMIINKPQGMVVHPSFGHNEGTLVNAIMHHSKDLSGINGVIRPGIVHRIDKDTSGLICVAKNDVAHNFLADQLKDHTMRREYYALVKGHFKENSGEIILPIGRCKQNRQKMAVDPLNGKEAVTFFKVIERFTNHTLVSCSLKTGRTHQIRVHMSYIGHPIEGDTLYSSRNSKIYKNGQLLTAYKLTLIHPTSKEEMTFEIPLPGYFKEVIDNLD